MPPATATNDPRTARPATIMDIARHVGMSKTTVSDALSGNGRLQQETREIILQAARELNYQAHPHAQSLRKRNSDEIILVSGTLDLGVSTRKMTQIQRHLSSKGYNASIHAYSQEGDGRLNQSALLATVARIQPRAVVCNAMTLEDKGREILLSLQSQGTVVVLYDFELMGSEDDAQLDQVIFDRADNTYQATKHLLELGHRKIGTVTFKGSPTSPIRLQGFERAMTEFGVPVRPEWNYSNPAAPADFIEITGQRAARYFLSLSERPTAVAIGVGDLAALAFIGEMSRAKVRIPEEISVIGQDNLPICEFASLRLSSVSHPVEAIAKTVSQRLIARLLNPDLRPEKHWIRGELFTRESTCSPEAA